MAIKQSPTNLGLSFGGGQCFQPILILTVPFITSYFTAIHVSPGLKPEAQTSAPIFQIVFCVVLLHKQTSL